MTSKIKIISDAFSRLGQPGTTIIRQNSNLWAAAESIYDQLLETTLQEYYWRFAMTIKSPIDRLTDTVLYSDWTYAYQLPADYLLLYRLQPLSDYEIFGKKLYSNATELGLVYISTIDESFFPGYFTSLMTIRLTAEIAMPTTQKVQLAEYWQKNAQSAYLRARSLDAATNPTPHIKEDPIFDAHFVGGDSY